jgi:hypothetical protein
VLKIGMQKEEKYIEIVLKMFLFMCRGVHNMNRFRATNNNKAIQYTLQHNSARVTGRWIEGGGIVLFCSQYRVYFLFMYEL